MLGFVSAFDENEICTDKQKIGFVHFINENEEDIKCEIAPLACEFARKFNLKKVFLFYGKDKKITYDYSL